MMLDVKIMDFIWTNFQDDREHAENLAGWKDDNLNPIAARMNQLLEASKNEVIYRTFDVDAFKQKSKALDTERAQIAELLR